jgi:manganese/zinc/iron transport system permease protein
VLGLHLAVWLDCPAAGAMVVTAGGLFVFAWVFSPSEGLLRRWRRARVNCLAP